MFTTLTKRGNQCDNSKTQIKNSSMINHKKNNSEFSENMLSSLINSNFKKENQKPQKNIVNIENFLRYSQKFQNLKAMQKDLEKLINS